ncbi:MAG: CAP domain-containing protein [Solirubrobacteraceae bacterium]
MLASALMAFVPAAGAHPAGAHRAAAHRADAHRRNRQRCKGANTPIAAASRQRLQRIVVCLINLQRTERHLPRLELSQRLNRSAQGWTNTMVSHSSFSHGADFAARISAVGFDWSMVGENIATGFRTPAGVVRRWMASTGHCQNILSPSFRDVGTGVSKRSIPGASSRPGTWTQDFGLPMGARPPSGNSGPANSCPY